LPEAETPRANTPTVVVRGIVTSSCNFWDLTDR
jgi:hypothetical protein